MEMSAEEFKEKRQVANISSKDFILNRTNALQEVSIEGPDGTIKIEIRTMLNKREVNEHNKFLTILQNLKTSDDELFEKYSIPFFALITTDNELNIDFWSSDDIDPYVSQYLIKAFIENYR